MHNEPLEMREEKKVDLVTQNQPMTYYQNPGVNLYY